MMDNLGANNSSHDHSHSRDRTGNEGRRSLGHERGSRGRGGGRQFGRSSEGMPMKSLEERVVDKLEFLFHGQPTTDLQNEIQAAESRDSTETKKFGGHCRLFIGNLPGDMTEKELIDLFSPYGELGETFVNKDKNFGFVRLDYRVNAEKAKNELDNKNIRSRNIKIRFAAHSGAVKVTNIAPFVSNELLAKAFSCFGEVEKAIVNVDGRGKPTGDGVVEFIQKASAQHCLQLCTIGCFYLTASLKPVFVEAVQEAENDDGLPEKALPSRNAQYASERSVPPRFATPDSFEFEYGKRVKLLENLKKEKIAKLEMDMKQEMYQLEQKMELDKDEYEIRMLREQLCRREAERDRKLANLKRPFANSDLQGANASLDTFQPVDNRGANTWQEYKAQTGPDVIPPLVDEVVGQDLNGSRGGGGFERREPYFNAENKRRRY